MLAGVSPGSGGVRLLSLPRDLLVEVEPGVEDRINTAYAYGGVGQAAAAVEGLTGISVDRHAIVDFGGFEEGINALGGVTLEVEEPIRLGIEGRRVYIPAGRQELNGLEALAYARYRGTACGDLGRIKRQQRLVAALRQQALGWNTITRLPGIVKVMHENVDTDLGIVQAISLGRALVLRGGEGGMRSFQLKGQPETLPNGDAVLVPDGLANEKVLEDFRDDAPTPTYPGQDQAPGDDGPNSAC
jgi:polyisoprenyl-teichoic acid--peptidoglycan teichoic acid transferase